MTEIECTAQTLIVHIQGADKIWSLQSQIQVPLSHVLGAEKDSTVAENWGKINWQALRAPGTCFPGVIKAGSFLSSGQWMFCDVHDPHKAITIRLSDGIIPGWSSKSQIQMPRLLRSNRRSWLISPLKGGKGRCERRTVRCQPLLCRPERYETSLAQRLVSHLRQSDDE